MIRKLLVVSMLLVVAFLGYAQENRPKVIVRINDPARDINNQTFELSKGATVSFEKYKLQRPADIDTVNLGLSVLWCSRNYYVSEDGANNEADDELFSVGNADFVAEDWGELYDEPWRIPTKEEFEELFDPNNCDWVYDSEKNRFKVTSKINSNFIYIPCAGLQEDGKERSMPNTGNYWTSPLDFDVSSRNGNYFEIRYDENARFDKLTFTPYSDSRTTRMSIRPVYGQPQSKAKPLVQQASAQDYRSAIIEISVENVDYEDILDCGIFYSTDKTLLPTNSNPQTKLRPVSASHSSSGIDAVTLNTLTSGQTYYVCAYVTTEKGTTYSESTDEYFTVYPMTVSFLGQAKSISESGATVTLNLKGYPLTSIKSYGVTVTGGEIQSKQVIGTDSPAEISNVVITGLEPKTEYTCVPFAVFNNEDIQGTGSLTFTTSDPRRVNEQFPIPERGVDLGLPSGLLWAPHNLYYKPKPDSVSYFFGWGDPTGTILSTGSLADYADGKTILNIAGTEYDIATMQWNEWEDLDPIIRNDKWRLPTRDDFRELFEYCTTSEHKENGDTGILFTNKKDPTKTLFIPLLGGMGTLSHVIDYVGVTGFYWTSEGDNKKMAYLLRLYKSLSDDYFELSQRYLRGCVRPVYGEIKSGDVNPDDPPIITPDPEDHSLDVGGYDTETAEGAETAYPMEAVDLDLPSGTKWAAWNVGAMEYGDMGKYYAWGEITTKDTFTSSNYIASVKGSFVYDLPSTADVVQQLWGKGNTDNGYWTMPGEEDFSELFTPDPMNPDSLLYVSVRWETDEAHNNHCGMRVISRSNGNSIFFPAGGIKSVNVNGIDSEGWYWSSSGSGLNGKRQTHAVCLNFGSDSTMPDGMYYDGSRNLERFFGFFVRPVWKENSSARELTTPE